MNVPKAFLFILKTDIAWGLDLNLVKYINNEIFLPLIIQKIIVIPILKSQVRLYVFFGILFGFYQFISWIEN